MLGFEKTPKTHQRTDGSTSCVNEIEKLIIGDGQCSVTGSIQPSRTPRQYVASMEKH